MVEINENLIYIIWAAAIVIFGTLEAVTAQLVSIWFVFGAIAALIASFFKVPFAVQVIIFVAVTVLALVITRPLVKKFINPKKVKTNADKVVGQTGIVVQDINNVEATGQVKVDGQIWTARSSDNQIITAGNEVIIEKIDGVKLIVKSK